MAATSKQIIIKKLGLVPYQSSLVLQEELLDGIIAAKLNNRTSLSGDQLPGKNYLLLCEHPHVYTLGRAGEESHLLMRRTELARQGIEFYVTNRGGGITYHGPGQLVVYPVLDLEHFFMDIHAYLRVLEEAVLATLCDFGVEGVRRRGLTGVWLPVAGGGTAKVCAMGVRVRRWVTMHGLALNVNTDLSYFGQIVPCGLRGVQVTSMAAALEGRQNVQKVAHQLTEHLCRLLGVEPCSS